MLSGIVFTASNVNDGVTAFWGIGAVVGVLGIVIAAKLLPQVWSVLKSLGSRR